MDGRKFDLNIQDILENWDVPDAIRELIANAMDEEALTHSRPMSIFKNKDGKWHIRDYGRGLQHYHLTQNESDEKLKDPHVIGKFGIGLKDALATFHRKKIKVLIRSKYGEISVGESEKHGFEDIQTLHAYIAPPSDPNLQGTEIVLEDCPDKDVEMAKDLFVRFSGENVLEETTHGQILARRGTTARIYVNGVKVAEEDNFLFSYNITSITAEIRKALNRERTNVGRTAYAKRVKDLLLSSTSRPVVAQLAENLKGYQSGDLREELKWLDVGVHACKILNSLEKVVFFTSDELVNAADIVDKAQRDGYRLMTVPDNVKMKLRGATDVSGRPIRDLEEFSDQWNKSFEFQFVDPKTLKLQERAGTTRQTPSLPSRVVVRLTCGPSKYRTQCESIPEQTTKPTVYGSQVTRQSLSSAASCNQPKPMPERSCTKSVMPSAARAT